MAKEQVTQAKTEAREARELNRSSDSNPNLTTVAATAAIGIVQETAREAMKNSHAPDPVEMVKAIFGMIPPHPPAPDTAPMFNTILGVVQESNKTMMQLVLSQNTELKNELTQIRQTPAAGLTVVDPMAKFKEFRARE
jgi:hypothetical protein